MGSLLSRLTPQPLTAAVAALLAVGALIAAWVAAPRAEFGSASLGTALLAAFLAAAIVAAGLNPIHIRHNIKVILTTVPLYGAALLLPPLVAGLVAGTGVLVAELLARSQRGNTPSDIATATGRWIMIAVLGAAVAQHMLVIGLPLPLVIIAVALLMFSCDIVTGAFEIAPMSNESPWRVMAVLVREASMAEWVQYLVAMLAVLAAWQQTWSLLLWLLPLSVIHQSFKYAKEMHDGTSKLLESLADAVDLRDPYTGGHSRRVTEYSMRILAEMGIDGPEVALIRSAARVHDIGKIGIPDRILNKPDRLTDDEKAIMDSHPERGAELLARYRDFARGMEIVRHHHERWDGQGYPAGLKGTEIPFGARVVAVADSFDAMTSDRPYRAGMPPEKAARILRAGRGQQWDAAIVDALLRSVDVEQPTTGAEAAQAGVARSHYLDAARP
jgi:HD-GYP domain-containing protein (c-di-GMP phosphodiesterase class II)